MANSKISDLTNYTAPQDADVIPIVSVASGITKKMPISAILPASSTDNAIVRFDGTTGKVVQNSILTVSDISGTNAFLGTPSVSGTGTGININGGDSSTTDAGASVVRGGNATGSGTGGSGGCLGGQGGATGAGGAAIVQGGAGGATSGDGGATQIIGGNATNGNGTGGTVSLIPGAKNGSGTNGRIRLYKAYGDNTNIAELSIDSIASSLKTFTFPNVTGNLAVATSGAGVPTGSAPVAIGQIYVDTSASKVYISKGTSAGSDWLILN